MKRKKHYYNTTSDFGCILSFIGYLILMFLLIYVVTSFFYRTPETISRWVIFFILFFVILYCDNSRIRKNIVKHIPQSFPFYTQLKKNRGKSDEISELYKTIIIYCLLILWNVSYFKFIFVGIIIVFSVLSLYRYFKYNSQIHFGYIDDKRFAPTTVSLLLPGILFFIWGLENQEYNLLFWILLIIIFLGVMIPFFFFSAEGRKKFSIFIGFAFCSIIWTFGILCISNRAFDFGQPTMFQVQIQNKESFHGSKSVSYYLYVNPWDDQTEEVQFDVSREEYENTDIGDTATIYQSDGALGMEWYELHINNN